MSAIICQPPESSKYLQLLSCGRNYESWGSTALCWIDRLRTNPACFSENVEYWTQLYEAGVLCLEAILNTLNLVHSMTHGAAHKVQSRTQALSHYTTIKTKECILNILVILFPVSLTYSGKIFQSRHWNNTEGSTWVSYALHIGVSGFETQLLCIWFSSLFMHILWMQQMMTVYLCPCQLHGRAESNFQLLTWAWPSLTCHENFECETEDWN